MRMAAAVSLVLLMAGAAHAAILAPQSVDPAHYISPPPADGSVDARAEMAEVNAVIARSTAAQIDQARKDDGDESPDIFNDVIGFDIRHVPQTFKLLNMAQDESETDTKAAKVYFHRKRPWVIDPQVKTCTLEKLDQVPNSYPSGHASMAYTLGVVLANIMPTKSQAILERAREYSQNRIVCGMHFRSDIAASQQFGTLLAVRLMENAAFQSQMNKAKMELAAFAKK